MNPSRKALILLSTLFCLSLLGMGCQSWDEEEELSARPWNSQKSWEHGLPQGLMEGR